MSCVAKFHRLNESAVIDVDKVAETDIKHIYKRAEPLGPSVCAVLEMENRGAQQQVAFIK